MLSKNKNVIKKEKKPLPLKMLPLLAFAWASAAPATRHVVGVEFFDHWLVDGWLVTLVEGVQWILQLLKRFEWLLLYSNTKGFAS